jgi:hypothetical protein
MRYAVKDSSNVAGTIYGINGKAYVVDRIEFDDETYHFFYGPYPSGTDISNDLFSKDKQLLVPDFDLSKENYRRASENGDYKQGGVQPLEENTAKIFVDQITSDPLAAPLETLNNTFDKLVDAPGVRKLALLGFVGLALYFVLKQADK